MVDELEKLEREVKEQVKKARTKLAKKKNRTGAEFCMPPANTFHLGPVFDFYDQIQSEPLEVLIVRYTDEYKTPPPAKILFGSFGRAKDP